MVKELLSLLARQPRTLQDLAVNLQEPADVVELALAQLGQRGYVAVAQEGEAHCPSCGGCSMKSMCPSTKSNSQAWRLTPKGEQRARR